MLRRCAMRTLLLALLVSSTIAASIPRRVKIDGQKFILASTNQEIVLSGPNVVVKGPPYMPAVSGSTPCNADHIDAACRAVGNCTTCSTFDEADIKLIHSQGRNFIRLGVIWAGAQPSTLDPESSTLNSQPSAPNAISQILNPTSNPNLSARPTLSYLICHGISYVILRILPLQHIRLIL